MSKSLRKIFCVNINFYFCSVYVYELIFFLNVYMRFGSEIFWEIKLGYISKILERVYFGSAC